MYKLRSLIHQQDNSFYYLYTTIGDIIIKMQIMNVLQLLVNLLITLKDLIINGHLPGLQGHTQQVLEGGQRQMKISDIQCLISFIKRQPIIEQIQHEITAEVILKIRCFLQQPCYRIKEYLTKEDYLWLSQVVLINQQNIDEQRISAIFGTIKNRLNHDKDLLIKDTSLKNEQKKKILICCQPFVLENTNLKFNRAKLQLITNIESAQYQHIKQVLDKIMAQYVQDQTQKFILIFCESWHQSYNQDEILVTVTGKQVPHQQMNEIIQTLGILLRQRNVKTFDIKKISVLPDRFSNQRLQEDMINRSNLNMQAIIVTLNKQHQCPPDIPYKQKEQLSRLRLQNIQ